MGVFAWRVGGASPWRDEAATVAVAQRGVAQIVRVTRDVDAVHLGYYLLAHLALRALTPLGLDPVTAVRWVSVVAMAATAGLLVRIGRRLGNRLAGVLAGLLLVASPLASRYAQEARPYAVATLAATTATYALLRALGRSDRGRGRWGGYALAVTATGVTNLFALLIVAGHGAYLLSTDRRRWRPWAWSLLLAAALIAPLAVMAAHQRGQISWLTAPRPAELAIFLRAQFESWPVLIVAAAAGLLGLARRRDADRPVRRAMGLGLLWAVLPPGLLWALAQVQPVFDSRYLTFALAGSALYGGAAAATIAPRARLGVLLVLLAATAGWPHQVGYRGAAGHGEDLRGAAGYLGANARAGDAVLFVPHQLRIVAETYSGPFAPLTDVGLVLSGARSGTISGVPASSAELGVALRGQRRVWVLAGSAGLGGARDGADAAAVRALRADYREVRAVPFRGMTVLLFNRPAGRPG